MANYFGHVSAILSQILMVQKAKLVLSLPNWYIPIYQTQYIPNQIHLIKPTELNPPNQFYQTKAGENKPTEN